MVTEQILLRVGTGFDIHRLVAGRKLILGGVEVPSEKGAFGHSDADVVLHSLIDAMLGASGAPDIGELFPDTDPQYKDIPSSFLFKKALEIMAKRNCAVVNLDAVIILERPKLGQFKDAIRTRLGDLAGLPSERVGVKAKTMEGLGAVGAGEAVACFATVLVRGL